MYVRQIYVSGVIQVCEWNGRVRKDVVPGGSITTTTIMIMIIVMIIILIMMMMMMTMMMMITTTTTMMIMIMIIVKKIMLLIMMMTIMIFMMMMMVVMMMMMMMIMMMIATATIMIRYIAGMVSNYEATRTPRVAISILKNKRASLTDVDLHEERPVLLSVRQADTTHVSKHM